MMKSSNEQKYITKNEQNPEHTPLQQQNSYIWYIISWVIFLLALGMFAIVYSINAYGSSYKITSNYYLNQFAVSSTAAYNASGTITNSKSFFTGDILAQPISVAMSLLFSWLLWKIPLIVFTYSLIEAQKRLVLRLISFGLYILILIGVDIILTSLLLGTYNEGMYFLLNWIVSLILIAVNNSNNLKKPIIACNVALLLIAFFYCCYSFFFPKLCSIYMTNINASTGVILWIFTYPILDLILYCLLLVASYYIGNEERKFLSFLHFQLIGYGVAMILLIGYYEPQFYYLLSYFIFRNIFVNWVQFKWQTVVNNPPCLPGWVICYYLAFLLNYVPLIGVGKLVISSAFKTAQWTLTSTIWTGVVNTDYPYTTKVETTINDKFVGNIFWLGGVIIWIGTTFTQKYPTIKPQWKDFFYNIIGIYLFYTSISCGLQLPQLINHSL